LIVQRPFQSVDGVRFCIDRKELTLELLFEVDPGLNWKNASVRLLAKEVLRPLRSTSVLEEGEGPKDFFLVAGELLWGQTQIQSAEVEEGSSRALFAGEVWRRREFWPRPLFGWGGQDWGRRADRRQRRGYWRQSDCWDGSGYELSKLL